MTTLWAYAPRAADEFELERGDMLRVVGIWDDGWATGIRLNERIDEKTSARYTRGGSASGRRDSNSTTGEIKAFPVSFLRAL